MSIEREILEDLDLLDLCTPFNPRYSYLSNKIKTNIKRSFNKREISGESEKTLTSRRLLIEGKFNTMKLYNVFSEYNKYVSSGAFILKAVEIKDLIHCINLCSKLLFIDDNALSLLNSDELVYDVTSKMSDKVKAFIDAEDYSNNDLYVTLNYLFKCCLNCLNREPLIDKANVILADYFKYSRLLLDVNKEFYYSPRILTKTLENCDYYIKGSPSYEDQNNYFVYYMNLFSLKCEEVFLLSPEDRDSKQKEILDEVNGVGLAPDLARYIQISVSNHISSIFQQGQVVDVILAMEHDQIEYLCAFGSRLLIEASVYAREFFYCFDRKSLIDYSLVCSDLISNIDAPYINRVITYNEALEYHFKLLLDSNIITIDEYSELYDDYRRE